MGRLLEPLELTNNLRGLLAWAGLLHLLELNLELNLLRLLELKLLRLLELNLLPVTCGGRLLEPLALFEVELVLLARGKRLFFAWRTLSLGPTQ